MQDRYKTIKSYIPFGVPERRHGLMGLLVYQAMRSLCDVTRDRWLFTFNILQQLEISSARSWAAPVRATFTVRPVYHIQNHTCRVTILQPDRSAAVLDQPSSLRPHRTPCLLPAAAVSPSSNLPPTCLPLILATAKRPRLGYIGLTG
jgi:hypothetical protein